MGLSDSSSGKNTESLARSKITLDGEYTALFTSMHQRVPTFHRFGRTNRNRDPGNPVSADYTACGMLVSSYDHDTERLVEKMDWVPMRHALVFGKPCRKCFPDAKTPVRQPNQG